jgi:hypothetical protein
MRIGSLRRAVPVAAMAAVLGLGCPKPSPIPPVGYIPKCPTHPLKFEVVVLDTAIDAYVTKLLSTIAISGERSSVVEVHDCQRLILASSAGPLVYGPLATIFASDSLDLPIAESIESRGLRASAAIYSWGMSSTQPGSYSSLGITAGWNCLYVFAHGNGVEARMVHALTDSTCLERLPPGKGTPLRVVQTPPPAGMSADDIPPVARWAGELGDGAHTNHIWIRCGNMSCEVGPADFKPEHGLSTDARNLVLALTLNAPETQRVLAVAGWYDQQLLGVPGSGGELEPSNVFATLIPAPSLGSMTEDSLRLWRVVAYAYLPDSAPGYADKLNFGKGINTISLRFGPKALVFEDGGDPGTCAIANTGDEWWGRIESANGGPPRYFCVHRWQHDVSGKDLPGTVRWQWLNVDERTWIRCPKGCCPIG